ncbi:MAG: HAD-IB family phosphatase [Clostridia bacterium]|nr:HAD-IB family phosphatase [Clostridia bacterium]
MNVYDFDGTIYRYDTTARFFLFCLRRHPRIVRRGPAVILAALRYLTGSLDKTGAKQVFLSFLADVPDPAAELELFWNREIRNVHRWYLAAHRDDDLVITASPEDFVRPACRRLGIGGLIGSPVDIRTGRYNGVNCDGKRKVEVFRRAFGDAKAERFYSDSRNDAPMAALAAKAFRVKGERVLPWPDSWRS